MEGSTRAYTIEMIDHYVPLWALRCLARREALLEEFEVSILCYTTMIEQHSNPVTFLPARSIVSVQEFWTHTGRRTNLWDIAIPDNASLENLEACNEHFDL